MSASSSMASTLSPRGVDGHQVLATPKVDTWRRCRNDRLRHSAPPHLTFASSTSARLAAARGRGAGRPREPDHHPASPAANAPSTAAPGGSMPEISVDTSRARSNLDVVRLCINELGWKEVRDSRVN